MTPAQHSQQLLSAQREMERELYRAARILRSDPSNTQEAFCRLYFAIHEFNRAMQGAGITDAETPLR